MDRRKKIPIKVPGNKVPAKKKISKKRSLLTE